MRPFVFCVARVSMAVDVPAQNKMGIVRVRPVVGVSQASELDVERRLAPDLDALCFLLVHDQRPTERDEFLRMTLQSTSGRRPSALTAPFVSRSMSMHVSHDIVLSPESQK